MTRDEVRAFFDVWQADWNRADPVALASRYADTASLSSPMFSRVTGRDGIADSYRALFASFPDWAMTFEEPLVDGNRLAMPFTVSATHQGDFMGVPGSGRRLEFQGVLLCTMDGPLIAEERRVYDFTGLLIKLGVLRSKPAR